MTQQKWGTSHYYAYFGCANCGLAKQTEIPEGTMVEKYQEEHPMCELCGCPRIKLGRAKIADIPCDY